MTRAHGHVCIPRSLFYRFDSVSQDSLHCCLILWRWAPGALPNGIRVMSIGDNLLKDLAILSYCLLPALILITVANLMNKHFICRCHLSHIFSLLPLLVLFDGLLLRSPLLRFSVAEW